MAAKPKTIDDIMREHVEALARRVGRQQRKYSLTGLKGFALRSAKAKAHRSTKR